MHIIDISNDLLTAEVYEDDPVPKLQSVRALEKGDPYTLNALYAGRFVVSKCFYMGKIAPV